MAAEPDSELQDLISAAADVRSQAYCPYSKFHVGAALLCEDGSIYTGTNVENASYGLCVCAERVAIFKAVSEGHRKFKAIAVSCDVKNSFKASCGACRQVFVEFGDDWDLYMVKPDLTWKKINVGELLPKYFGPNDLKAERI